jgi:hypothetical protein
MQDHTEVTTRDHLLVLQMLVNLCQNFASDRSTIWLAEMMRSLPDEGLPNLVSKAFVVKFKTEEYAAVAGSSPGPVENCSDQHIRRAFEVLNRSTTIEKQRARREFQVEYLLNKFRPEWDAQARRQHPPRRNFEVNRDFRFEDGC